MRSFSWVYALVLKLTSVLNISICAVAQIIHYIYNKNIIDDKSYWFVYTFSREISSVLIINYF